MLPSSLLVACRSCGCHARAADSLCPHCGKALRRHDGTFGRTASAVLLGLSALVLPLGSLMSCSSSSTGGEGTGGGGGAGGGSVSATTTVATTSTYATTTTTTIASTYATGPSTTTGGGCDGTGDCNTCLECSQGPGGACEDELTACLAEMAADGCADLITCMNACADQACVDACLNSHPGGVAAFGALYACLFCDDCYNDCLGANDPNCG